MSHETDYFDPDNPPATEGGDRDWTPPPPSTYLFCIEQWEIKEGKKGPYVNIAYSIIGGQYDGRWIWDTLSFSPKAGWRWAALFKSLGWTVDHGPIDRNSDDELSRWFDSGKTFKARTFIDSYTAVNRETQRRETRRSAKIKKFLEPDGDTDPMPLPGEKTDGGPPRRPHGGRQDAHDDRAFDGAPGPGYGEGDQFQGQEEDDDMPF